MITRQQLEIINRRSLKYPLHIAEKDYLLTLVLQIIAMSNLGKTLVFKGGTALHHCYLEQCRFSEDLDFSSNQTAVSLEKVRKIFEEVEYLTIKKTISPAQLLKLKNSDMLDHWFNPTHLKSRLISCRM